MQNFPEGYSPFIMELNKHTDYRVIFGKPLANGTTTLHPSLVTLAQGVPGLTSNPTVATRHFTENTIKQYTPYTNSNETWKILNMIIGDRALSGYEVSNQGRLRRCLDQSIIPLFLCNETGLVFCDLSIPSHQRIMVDALVCHMFCMDTLKDHDQAKVVVHHRDNNRLNNHADNLEFMLTVTHNKIMQENQPHDHTVVLDGRLYHHFGARLQYLVSREYTRRC